MKKILALYQTTVGKKVAMALSGGVLFAWLIAHMAGNLKVFQGAEKFNAYAEFLREMGTPVFSRGELLWVNRIVLLAVVAIHIVASIQLTRQAKRARPVRYQRPVHLEDSYASRTMRWGGVIIAAFIVYHLLHLTVGTVHADFIQHDAYHNLVSGFQALPVALAYIVAVTALGFHLYHGLWSAFQTLGFAPRRHYRLRRGFVSVFSVLIVTGFLVVPIAVVLGIVQ